MAENLQGKDLFHKIAQMLLLGIFVYLEDRSCIRVEKRTEAVDDDKISDQDDFALHFEVLDPNLFLLYHSLGCHPDQDAIVTTRIIYYIFSRGSRTKPSFAIITGRRDNPIHSTMHVFLRHLVSNYWTAYGWWLIASGIWSLDDQKHSYI